MRGGRWDWEVRLGGERWEVRGGRWDWEVRLGGERWEVGLGGEIGR